LHDEKVIQYEKAERFHRAKAGAARSKLAHQWHIWAAGACRRRATLALLRYSRRPDWVAPVPVTTRSDSEER
jgi:hypothetical protein